MGGVVAAASDIAAYQTYPEIGGGPTDAAFVVWTVAVPEREGVGLCVSADGTPAASPFLETCTVEDVLA